MRRILTTSCLMLTCCLLTAPAFAQLDQIFGKGGVPTRGVITAMSPDVVTIEQQGVARKFQVQEIKAINFAEEPRELENGRTRIQSGQLEDALTEFKKINLNDVRREAVRQDIEYYMAYIGAKLALAGQGEKAKASEGMFNFIKNNRGSYHFYEGVELLGDLSLANKDAKKAIAFYGQLERAPWEDMKLRASVLQARAMMASKDFQGAAAKFDTVLRASLNTPEVAREKMFANIGKAVCLAEAGSPDKAINGLNTIIQNNDPSDSELFARAYNALGRCYLKQDKAKDALLAYLHVDILFYKNADAHAESLYYLSKLWTQVNKSDRAVKSRQILGSRYAGSIWAAM